MEQILFNNGIVKFPIIVDEGVNYYPISYISEKVLMRKGKIVDKNNEHKYKINTYKVDFSFVDGGIHNTKCIDEDGLKNILKSTRIGHLDVLQRAYMNFLLKYLNIPLVSEELRYLPYIDDETISGYDQYIQDAINEVEGEYSKWQKCSKCDCYYPLHENFFKKNQRSSKVFNTFCRSCSSVESETIKSRNSYLENIYKKYGDIVYSSFKNSDVINIYKYCTEYDIKFPKAIRNKNAYLKIVKWLSDNNKINKYNFTQKDLMNKHGLKNLNDLVTMNEIYTFLFGELYYLYAWRYNASIFKFKNLDYEIANEVFRNYINEFNVDDTDILKLNYFEIVKMAGISSIINSDILYFAVQYNKFKYPGYMFKTSSMNYYKNEDNLLFDLKYLIEQDMTLDILKIPLYLTKYVLQKKCLPLYHYIVTNKNGSIFEWVNKLYPNQFIEADFEVNPYRNEFDSDKEMFIHEILKERFSSVIYNQRNTEHTIKINGMVPDWLVFTDHGVYIVEYFGMYIPEAYETSSRIKVYIDKMNRKLERYKEVDGYKFIYLYPDDVEDDFFGCRDKLDKVCKNPYISMV